MFDYAANPLLLFLEFFRCFIAHLYRICVFVLIIGSETLLVAHREKCILGDQHYNDKIRETKGQHYL